MMGTTLTYDEFSTVVYEAMNQVPDPRTPWDHAFYGYLENVLISQESYEMYDAHDLASAARDHADGVVNS